MADVRVLRLVAPGAHRGVAGRRLGRAEIEVARALARAGVVGAVVGAHVVRIVLLAIDAAGHVAAGVDRLQSRECTVDGPGRARVLVLAVGRRERGQLHGAQRGAVGILRVGVEVAVGFRVLVVLLDQDVPVLVELVQRGQTRAGVVHGVQVVAGHAGIGGDRTAGPAGRQAGAGTGREAHVSAVAEGRDRDRARHVVDPAARVVGEDHAAQGEVVAERHVQGEVAAGSSDHRRR